MQITFTPGGAGARSATPTVTDSASTPTQTVTLTGAGAQTAVAVSPDNIDFGTFPVGNSGTVHAVTITSNGTAGLHVTGESLGGADPSDFAECRRCGPGCGTPAGVAAQAEVLITILPGTPGTARCHAHLPQRAGTSLAGVVISAPRCG